MTSADSPAPVMLQVAELAITHDGADAPTPASASFEVSAGEVVLLLGPSGSGKSTLALALNGLIPQSIPATLSGQVVVAGMDAAQTPVATLSTHVAMVFQDPDAQLVTGTVLDDVAFGPENLCAPVGDVLARTEDALRRVNLWDRRRENPDRLSGGGRQRLAIACALAMNSPLLVLDEPTANLDPQGTEEVYAALADVVATGDRAIVLIEHNLDAAVGLASRVVVLDASGRTVADGDVDGVLRGRAAELHAMGVWLPAVTIAALRLQRAGWVFERMPLTADELHAALAGQPGPAPAGSPGPAAAPAPVTAGSPLAAQARHLTLRRGKTDVLHDVSLSIAPGDFVAIVGANGAGKTSLIQALAGVLPAPRGTVSIGGVDLTRASARTLASRIGFVFQNPEHQFIAATVFDEIAHGLRLQKLPADEVQRRTTELLTRFGLEDKASQHPFLLSGGQKRRLSVGTALVAGAPVLALDEPTFGQDRARADELLTLLHELNAGGTTIIVVTHDMQLVSEYATRMIVVGDGRIAADATPAELFADEALLRGAGLRVPPLARALRGIPHPSLQGRTRLVSLPGGPQ